MRATWPVVLFRLPSPDHRILTAGQKRRRIERLQKCITSLEAFDPQKVRKRFGNPEVLALEAAIDKGLSSAFGYGTAAYTQYNQAATLDPGPHTTSAALPVRGPGRRDAQAQEARQHFSNGTERSIAMLRKAIDALEDEIAAAQPVIEAPKESKAPHQTRGEVLTVKPKRRGGIDLQAAWRRVGRWWAGRN